MLTKEEQNEYNSLLVKLHQMARWDEQATPQEREQFGKYAARLVRDIAELHHKKEGDNNG